MSTSRHRQRVPSFRLKFTRIHCDIFTFPFLFGIYGNKGKLRASFGAIRAHAQLGVKTLGISVRSVLFTSRKKTQFEEGFPNSLAANMKDPKGEFHSVFSITTGYHQEGETQRQRRQ